ncbi:hypothetical protein BT96DRAFT_1023548 [Gymnopus androsaceus JB14]|uniref:F-box domain-containing protein n=1 Tax=Gymnopus androsaceus JB14 TaxID=1447944 RepID=A0A6A4H491_9AGAR|nr:hypothetical protein BT96DRAFT_1023548 [Gymnopus androsaceus JB14]
MDLNHFMVKNQSFNQITLDRLRAGYVPCTSLELMEIRTFLLDADHSLRNHERENQGFQPARTQLLRAEITLAIANAQALTSPIRKLPSELLCEIFDYYVGDALSDPRVERTTRVICPVIFLTWVCSFWRNLSWARPLSWSSPFISFTALLQHPTQIDFFQYCMAQSANATTLDITIIHGKNETDEPLIHAVYDTLFEHCSRWHSFSSLSDWGGEKWNIYTEGWALDSGLDLFPNLKSLQWEEAQAPLELLDSCPQLQIYRAGHLSISPNQYHLFSNLRELSIGYMESYSVRDVLYRMPLLEKFVLWQFNPVWDVEGYTSIVCSNISTLCVSLEAIRYVDTWESLQFPGLRVLELGGEQFTELNSNDEDEEELEMYCRAIVDFSKILSNAGSILQTVKLEGIPGKEAVAFLSLHPSISDLTLLMLYRGCQDFFIGLDISQNSGPAIVLPKLCSLSISIDELPEIYDIHTISDKLCQLVESRSNTSRNVVTLENLALESDFQMSPAGVLVYARLSDRMTILAKKREDFYIESTFPLQLYG